MFKNITASSLFRLSAIFCGSAAIIVFVLLRFRNSELTVAHFGRDGAYIVSDQLDLGDVPCGDFVTLDFNIASLSSQDGTIVGASSSCSCLATVGLPKRLPAKGVASVSVEFNVPKVGGPFLQSIKFYVNTGRLLTLSATISGAAR